MKSKLENLTTNGNGKSAAKKSKTPDKRTSKDYEVDGSKALKSFMKAVELTHRRLYPELFEENLKRA
jgi:hypothetical protein